MARKEISIVGVAPRLTGVGKRSGRAFDMQNISVTFPQDGYNGLVATELTVDGSIIDRLGMALQPGMVATAVVHQASFKWFLDDILDLA